MNKEEKEKDLEFKAGLLRAENAALREEMKWIQNELSQHRSARDDERIEELRKAMDTE